MGELFKTIDASSRDIHITGEQKARAVHTLARYAHHADDLRLLLDMTGLRAEDRYAAAEDVPEARTPRATPARRRRLQR